MDIQREIKEIPVWRKYWYVAPIVFVISLVAWGKSFLGDSSYVLEKQKFQYAKVEQGEFKVEVRAIGVLKPQDIRLVPALSSGRVEQILVKPGAYVTKGQLLVKLSNPELRRELEKAHWEFQANKAEMQASIVSLESQLVDIENSVDEAQYNYKSTKLKLDAESELMNLGNGSISKLDFERTKLSVEHQKQRWAAQNKRMQKMIDNMKANKIAQQARLELAESNYQRVELQVSELAVKSSMEGIVQQTSLVLGQQLASGESVATIASKDSLFAELQVQELQIKDIVVGLNVVVDTRSSEISGIVTRIDPSVDKGMVMIDIELTGELPAEARPELNVEGRIITSQIENALFVRRPSFAPQNSQVNIFRLSDDQRYAFKEPVETGLSSVTHIQIISGLKNGDSIITSDITPFQNHQQVLIN
ncbi:MAG: HlyD family efflux transporter periplasmic adaptor subunit [Kangiellaceae bacterium]|nr:HlyD family efflux transporter periplasmic adaptor subunit [Kangiellaceae bacterium]